MQTNTSAILVFNFLYKSNKHNLWFLFDSNVHFF